PRKVTSPLLRRHSSADLKKMFSHFDLAFTASPSPLGQQVFNFRSEVGRAGKQLLQLPILLSNPHATLLALRQIRRMHLQNPSELRIAQMEFLFQPSQFGLGLAH